jgi:hypothetical protein
MEQVSRYRPVAKFVGKELTIADTNCKPLTAFMGTAPSG